MGKRMVSSKISMGSRMGRMRDMGSMMTKARIMGTIEV